MRPTACLAAILFLPSLAFAAGTALTDNFNVIGPSAAVAEAVAKQAEVYRKQAALEWLGKELPRGQGQTMVTVILSADKDDGLTWPIDRPERKYHELSVITSFDRAVGPTLHHEVVHTVLDTYTGIHFLPPWANEGIASQADAAEVHQARRKIAQTWADEGSWPQLEPLFHMRRIAHSDCESYAAASSLVEYLASLRGKPQVVAFAQAGPRTGWDQAASDCYGIRDLAELQSRWQRWVTDDIARDVARTAENKGITR